MLFKELKIGLSPEETLKLIPDLSIHQQGKISYASHLIILNNRSCDTGLNFEDNKLTKVDGLFHAPCTKINFSDFGVIYQELFKCNTDLYGTCNKEEIFHSDYSAIDTTTSHEILSSGHPEYRFIDIARASWERPEHNFTSYLLLSIEPSWDIYLKFENKKYKPWK